MATKKTSATRLDRERVRRRRLEQSKGEYRGRQTLEDCQTGENRERSNAMAPTPADAPPASARVQGDVVATGGRQPGQQCSCVWCGRAVIVKARGPLPKFCSPNCRHRAWEQARAARAGRAAVVVVDRAVVSYPGDVQGWLLHLDRLTQEIRAGRLDVDPLTGALDDLSAAVLDRRARRHAALLQQARFRSW